MNILIRTKLPLLGKDNKLNPKIKADIEKAIWHYIKRHEGYSAKLESEHTEVTISGKTKCLPIERW